MAEIRSPWMVPEPVDETFENHNMATGYLHYFEIVGDDDNNGNDELLPTIGFEFHGIHPHAKLEILDTDDVDQIQYFKRGIHYGLRFGQVELTFSKPEPNVCIATVYIAGANSRNSIRIKCATYTRMVNYIRDYLPAVPAAVAPVAPAPLAVVPPAPAALAPVPAPPAEPSANNEPYEPNMPAPSERRRRNTSKRGAKKQRKTRRR